MSDDAKTKRITRAFTRQQAGALAELQRELSAIADELRRTAEELRSGADERTCREITGQHPGGGRMICARSANAHGPSSGILHDFAPGIHPHHAANRLKKIANRISTSPVVSRKDKAK